MIKGDSVDNQPKWEDWFNCKPCRSGWEDFSYTLGADGGGLLKAVAWARFPDACWGAYHTHRPLLLAALATERNEEQILWLVTQNPNASQGTLEYLSKYNHPLVAEGARKALEARGY